MKRTIAAISAVLTVAAGIPHAAIAADNDVAYTVGKYPVEASAQNAVAAKEKALADGQQAAFRSLLKRLVPVTSYKAISALKSQPAANLVEGIAVQSERNSSTSYSATLDFSFSPKGVREVMQRRGLPYVDEQAPETALVLVYLAPPAAAQAPGALAAAAGARTWKEVWTGLDTKYALTPLKLHDAPANLTAELIKASQSDPNAPLRAIAALSKTGQALLAIAEPDVAARRLVVTLSGTDAVGSFVLKRSWRLDPADVAYTAELAAVVALGTLEGRWKAVRRPGAPPPMPTAGMPMQPVQMFVEFASLQDWQRLRQRIAEMPGVADFMVGGMSARSADVALRYPGGGERLAAALASQSIEVRNAGGTWIARAAH